MIRHIAVSIDGPAASGKSTVGHIVARKLGANFLDSGKLYRVAALSSQKSGLKLPELLEATHLEMKGSKFILNGEDVSNQLDSVEIGELASQLSVDQRLREWVNRTIRELAINDSIIVAGRDIGTVVLPDARVKIYLDASIEQRTKRRFLDVKKKQSFESIHEALRKRDARDSGRDVAPLKPADDATIIDSTNLSRAQVVKQIYNLVKTELDTVKLTWWWKFSYWVCINIAKKFWNIKIYGKGNVPSQGAAMVVCNHTSIFDVFYLGLALPRMGFFLAKAELFKIPLISWCVRGYGAIPVRRGLASKDVVKGIDGVLKSGKCFIIYPEGTRSKTGLLSGHYHLGAAMFAHRAKVDIIPVGIKGAFEILPFGRKWPRRGNLVVRVGKPITWDKYAKGTKDLFESITALSMEAVAILSDQPIIEPVFESQ
jgi:cytidylate kinase